MANSGYARLKKEQEKALWETKERQKQLENYKEDYKTLKDKLLVLPEKVKYDVMVPIGKLGFMPGQLVHTNEVTVLLGDNWFVERSAKQAAEIVDRRLIEVEKQLEVLNQQASLLEPRLQFSSQLEQEAAEGVVEIQEEYNEEEDKLWREQHRRKVREYNLEQRKQQTLIDEGKVQGLSSRDAAKRLDKLDVEEQVNIEEELEEQLLEILNSSGEEDDDEDDDDGVEDDGEDEYSEEEELGPVIYITHTKDEDRLQATSSGESDIDSDKDAPEPLYRSPADIPSHPPTAPAKQGDHPPHDIHPSVQSVPQTFSKSPKDDSLMLNSEQAPRSILKTKSLEDAEMKSTKRVGFTEPDEAGDRETKPRQATKEKLIKEMMSSAFSGTVKECFPEPGGHVTSNSTQLNQKQQNKQTDRTHSEQSSKNPNKPVSKFKKARMQNK